MIAILDYGVGNLRSISKALEFVGAKIKITKDYEDIEKSDAIVLPGVGAFTNAMNELKPLVKVIKSYTRPILGICLGMQLFFTKSEEGGISEGLNLIEGRVVKFPSSVKIPHMGWNSIRIISNKSKLLNGIKSGEYFYFVHSYYCIPKEEDVKIATTLYGVEFSSVIEKENIFATQFHPEKSGEAGLKIIRNFVNIVDTWR